MSTPTLGELRKRIQAVPGLTSKPVDYPALHDAVIAETIRLAGPRTFRTHLAKVVAAHLQTKDAVLVEKAIEGLLELGLVVPVDQDGQLVDVMPF